MIPDKNGQALGLEVAQQAAAAEAATRHPTSDAAECFTCGIAFETTEAFYRHVASTGMRLVVHILDRPQVDA